MNIFYVCDTETILFDLNEKCSWSPNLYTLQIDDKKFFQDEDDALVDDAPSVAPSTPNNGKRMRKTSDVIDSYRDHEFSRPGHSTPRQKKPMQLDLVRNIYILTIWLYISFYCSSDALNQSTYIKFVVITI